MVDIRRNPEAVALVELVEKKEACFARRRTGAFSRLASTPRSQPPDLLGLSAGDLEDF